MALRKPFKELPTSPTPLKEKPLHEVIMTAINSMVKNQGDS